MKNFGGTLIVDSREQKTHEMFGAYESLDIEIVNEKLNKGDYMIKHQDMICFYAERKTYGDFMQSRNNGRLKEQMNGMADYREENKERFVGKGRQRLYLILECDDNQYERIMERYMDDYDKFKVIHTLNSHDTGEKLVKLEKSILKMDNLESIKPVTGRIKRLFE